MWIAKGADPKETVGRENLGLISRKRCRFHSRWKWRKGSLQFTGWEQRLANPRNFQKERERSPKVLVIVVGTLNIIVLSVNIRNIGVMHSAKWVI